MRALESHSVDVTFFYVPQIVQTLRYDVLGYVERYIVETAKFSQIFAHQIIWNMKANAYKDEDSKIVSSIFHSTAYNANSSLARLCQTYP
jgi:phosphatidylinositol 4-kinase